MSIKYFAFEGKVSRIDFSLLATRVNYMMSNPTGYLFVGLHYDPDGRDGRNVGLPKSINTKGKVFIRIIDNRGVFSYKPGISSLGPFKKALEEVYSFIEFWATDINADVVALFSSSEEIPLGYFYQGEYHLWEK